MAIYSLNHSHIGKTTQAKAGTAGAHVRYITRRGAVSLVLGEHMPTRRDSARAWLDERELSDRKNGRVCDKVFLALPVELDSLQRAEAVREFMQEFGAGRVSWLAGIHDRGEDEQNPHAHILIRDKDHETGKRVFGTTEKGSTDRIRELWETVANRALERAGEAARIDRRSLADQGIDREPGIHIGPNVRAMEERGLRPISIAQELDNGRVVNWPEIDQGRTRADRQREIEAGNLEREQERERGKAGDRGADLVPVVEWDLSPAPAIIETQEPQRELEAKPAQEAHREPEAVWTYESTGKEPEAIHAPEKRPQRDDERRSQIAELMQMARDKLAGMAARLEAVGQRLELAFQPFRERQAEREREREKPPEPQREAKPIRKPTTERQREAPERMPEAPAPKRSLGLWDDVIELGRKLREEQEAAMTPEQRAERDRKQAERREQDRQRGRSLFPDYSRGRDRGGGRDGPGF